MGGVLSLKKALLLLLVLQLLSMFTGCKQFKLGNLTWDKFHVRYWIILDDEKLLEKSEALVLVTNHQDFLNKEDLFKKFKIKAIVDGVNCLDKEKIKKAGIRYHGIGSF
jgi:hypothetical protein